MARTLPIYFLLSTFRFELQKFRHSPTQQTFWNHSFCVLFWKNINCSMKSTVSFSSFRWKIINYFNYTSFVLETDKNFLVTSNNLFHCTKWSEAKAKLPATPPETTKINTHCKISLVFAISYHVHNQKKLFVWNQGCWCRFRHGQQRAANLVTSRHLTLLIHAPRSYSLRYKLEFTFWLNVHFHLHFREF